MNRSRHLMTLLSIVFAVTIVKSQPIEVENQASNDDACMTPICLQAAKSIQSRIDPSIDPCDNFYEFACGTFSKNAVILDELTANNSINTINTRIREQIKLVLEAESNSTELRAFRLTRKFYNSCMNVSTIEERGLAPVKELMKNYGGWPVIEGNDWNESDWNWLDAYKKMFNDGITVWPFFELDVMPSFVNSTINRIFIKDSEKLTIDRELFLNSNDTKIKPKLEKYLELMIGIAKILGANNSNVEDEMKDVLNFELKLAEIADSKHQDGREYSLDTSEGTRDMITLKDLVKAYSYFPWIDFLSFFMPNEFELDKDQIIVPFTVMFEDLNELMKNTSKRTIANYLMWRVAYFSSELLTDELSDKLFEFDRFLTGIKRKSQRWRFCVKKTIENFKMSTDSMWLRRYFHQKTKKDAAKIVERIYNRFIENLKNVSWIDDETRNFAIEKANAMEIFIGYPEILLNDTALEDTYRNIEIHQNDFIGNILRMQRFHREEAFANLLRAENRSVWAHYDRIAGITSVNAYYSIRHNSINIPAALLENEIFSSDLPNYMKFGVLGWSVAHEMTHGYDETGSLLDAEGNLFAWWDTATRVEFTSRGECFTEQYANFTGDSSNKTKTKDEDIADNGGVKVAYGAYQQWVNENGIEERLPGLQYTPEQLFWIANANFWCRTIRPEMKEYEYLTNDHTADSLRVIGSVSNMPAFAKDFNCASDSKMNPSVRCSIW